MYERYHRAAALPCCLSSTGDNGGGVEEEKAAREDLFRILKRPLPVCFRLLPDDSDDHQEEGGGTSSTPSSLSLSAEFEAIIRNWPTSFHDPRPPTRIPW